MTKTIIKQLIESYAHQDGMTDMGVKGVRLFKVTDAVRCAPAIYEPAIIAIVSGTKEAIRDIFLNRVKGKKWLEVWPNLEVII